ncbi:MAG: Nif3-like dinuclear metal center hexameric protein [Bacteroidota bacterium]
MANIPKISTITRYLETFAPPIYQEDYDNSGIQVGDPHALLKGILLALDPTEAVLAEAVQKECNLVITHHPLLFRPVKKITPDHAITRAIRYALQHDLHLYAIHTNLDHVVKGISHTLAAKLHLEDVRPLIPMNKTHLLLTTYLPLKSVEKVKKALFNAGAGEISTYQGCSFLTQGEGTFTPTEEANPFIGEPAHSTSIQEACLRTLIPIHHQQAIIDALLHTHPYETPLYHTQPLPIPNKKLGTGLIGHLSQPFTPNDFLSYVKEKLDLPALRYTDPPHQKIQRIALCGGSGSTFLPQAARAKVDAYLTADTKYHQFFEAHGKLMLVDIGHYESEIGFKDLLYRLLSEKFDNIAVQKCTTNTNPIRYQ